MRKTRKKTTESPKNHSLCLTTETQPLTPPSDHEVCTKTMHIEAFLPWRSRCPAGAAVLQEPLSCRSV
ncbi:hypothetical protein PBY51_008992 [Eleginops maclovinus]|uniref:Uncharacterized protein n=1 Tax=Eleginops maclovinus TaxID=56733 RepID=A0AAN8ABX1_ELEMC|nr:hypothetical protein PBY51_008992 [Eleginops maclovinus]